MSTRSQGLSIAQFLLFKVLISALELYKNILWESYKVFFKIKLSPKAVLKMISREKDIWLEI
jgi:hypothetical protein